MALLEVINLHKNNDTEQVVRDISFTQQSLQKIAIAGETGSGKSTLLKMIAGLVQPDSGQVLFEDKKVIGPDDKLVAGHPSISYLSQHFELPKSLRVEQVLTYANLLSDQEADTLYEVCHIHHLLKRRTDQLSGGEKQRVALARLLTTSPKLLLLDEPFSNLDRIHKTTLQSTITSIGEQLEITIILVSHDPADTLSWANEIVVMKEGMLVQQGSPSAIYHQPVNEYVAGLFGKFSQLIAEQSKSFKTDKRFLRPEEFIFTKEGIKARVKRILFYGGYYEVEVICDGNPLMIRVNQNVVSEGDDVCVSLSPAYIAGNY